ncbi:MAG: hypothetical protein PHC88_09390 [Terrimicrobiaceae bacterium]|nr:hypothetical protein [Terrimicrobiaceae bacterium]
MDWVHRLALQKLSSSLPYGAETDLAITTVRIARIAAGMAEVAVAGRLTLREPLYEIVTGPNRDILATAGTSARAYDQALKRYWALRPAPDWPPPDLSTFSFLRKTADAGAETQFETNFEVTRDGFHWTIDSSVPIRFSFDPGLIGKARGKFGGVAPVEDSAGSERVRTMVAKMDGFCSAVAREEARQSSATGRSVSSGNTPAGRSSGEDAERQIRALVASFLDVCGANDPGRTVAFYAPEVDYFDNGRVNHDFILIDVAKYQQRWPVRRDTLEGEIEVSPLRDSQKWLAKFNSSFSVQSAERGEWIKGLFALTLEIEIDGDQPLITTISERVIRREKGRLNVPENRQTTHPRAGASDSLRDRTRALDNL